ncbi:MAG TPA: hypothetical protein VE999_06910 [Gemmataceae bacterium]|nr:hypothetical protein [Gemmataceae bacterium]
MMNLLTQIVVWLNSLANVLGRYALAPLAAWPDWLSVTLTSVVSGMLFLIAFKYTSSQGGIKRVKDGIKANLLSLKLFKDNAGLALRAQGRILFGAFQLLVYSLVPMLVMLIPVLLILGQLALWYQDRPLQVGEDAIVTLKLNPANTSTSSNIELKPIQAVESTLGPVHVWSKHEVCWNIRARENGYHRLVFRVGEQTGEKELAVGDGLMRISKLRPAWHWLDVLLNPWEKPFDADSPIQSIEIDYPSRESWTSGTKFWSKYWLITTLGTESWVIYWFVISMVAGFCLRRPLNVNI